MRQVRILEEAAEEAISAAAWYEREHPGLGSDFNAALNSAFDLLEEEIVPLTSIPGTVGKKGAKRLSLRRFPYELIVLLHSDEAVVVAVAHQSRRPGYWRRRLHTE